MKSVNSIFNNIARWTRGVALAGALGLTAACGKEIVGPGGDGNGGTDTTPNISLTTQLQEGTTNIRYDVSGKNLSGPIYLTATRNGSPVSDMSKTASIGSGFYNNTMKGTYDIKACATGTNGKEVCDNSTSTTVNYKPSAGLGGLQIAVASNSNAVLDLEDKVKNSDINNEDRPVPVASVTPLDGKTTTSLNGYRATITPVSGASGDARVEIKYGTSEGGMSADTVGVNISQVVLPRFTGVLQDTDSHAGQRGEVRFYKLDSDTTLFASGQTTASGNFDVQSETGLNDLTDRILVEARAEDASGNPTSYVRRFVVPTSDIQSQLDNRTIRVVTYDGLSENGISVNDFYRFGAEIQTPDNQKTQTDAIGWNPTILKWKDGGPAKIEVSKTAMQGDTGFFTQEAAEKERNRITDPNDVGAIFQGRFNSSNTSVVESHSFDKNLATNTLYVYPTRTSVEGICYDTDSDGYCDTGEVKVGVFSEGSTSSDYNLPHEIEHSEGNLGHPLTFDGTKTFLASGVSAPAKFKFADIKFSNALNNTTYTHGNGTGVNWRLRLGDFLGLKWTR